MREEKIVGVMGGEGEDADAGAGKRASERFEDAGLGKLDGTENAEAPEGALGLDVRGNGSLRADDGEFFRRSRDRDESASLDPCRDTSVRMKPCDCKPFGE